MGASNQAGGLVLKSKLGCEFVFYTGEDIHCQCGFVLKKGMVLFALKESVLHPNLIFCCTPLLPNEAHYGEQLIYFYIHFSSLVFAIQPVLQVEFELDGI